MVSPKALKNPRSLQLASDGTGPYMFDKGKTTGGQVYTLKRNPKYWAAARLPFDTSSPARSPSRRRRQHRPDRRAEPRRQRPAGHVDPGLEDRRDLPRWASTASSSTTRTGKLNTPLKDVRVRQAMNYADQPPAIVKAVYHGLAVPNPSVAVHPDSPGWDAVKNFYPYNVNKAKQLLGAGGLPQRLHAQGPEPAAGRLHHPADRRLPARRRREPPDRGPHERPAPAGAVGHVAAGALLLTLTGRPFTDVSADDDAGELLQPAAHHRPEDHSCWRRSAAAKNDKPRNDARTALAKYATAQAWFVAPVLIESSSRSTPRRSR